MTTLVARELARYKVDIDALSETQFPEQGQLEELAQRLASLPVAAATEENASVEADGANSRAQSRRRPWLSSIKHVANTRTNSTTTTAPSATC
ncbi:hypothetical protein SprV_0100401200 [Sparganum proliferum]